MGMGTVMEGAEARWAAAPGPASGPEGLATALAETLPSGSGVVVRWRDPRAGDGVSESAGASTALHARAEALLGSPAADGLGGEGFCEAWNAPDGARIAVVAHPGATLADASREAWLALVRRTVEATLAAAAAEARIEALQKSQRLQQALYEIADLSGSGLEMQEMLGRIHAVVGRLMYAENFYIVLYDDVRDAVRFLYFADRLDPYVAEPDVDIAIDEMSNSLTVALLRHGRPLLGPSARLRRELGVSRDAQ